ncbi:MAG TPA: SRPBCC domain-containing protein [Kofleriaceae bacterium]
MSATTKNKLVITLPSDTEILMTRDFDAPRALVWEMFTKPEHIKQWWGCGHIGDVSVEMDVHVGGTYRFVGKTPDGRLVPFKGEYREIDPPNRIVFTEIYDVDMARDHPSVVTTTFTEANGKTTMHLLARYDSKETRDIVISSGMEHGAAAGYDAIERMLEPLTQVTLTREFAAPRKLVWAAWTEPSQFAKWFGPRGFSIPRIELDVRAGGALRYDMRAPNGMTMTNLGAFIEVIEPERLVYTERSEQNGEVAFEILNTVTFAEQSGKTLVTLELRVVRANKFAPITYAGEGWTQALDKLGELLAR